MSENRRTPQGTILKTTGHPNEQYECLETIYQSVLMFISVYLSRFNTCLGLEDVVVALGVVVFIV